MLQLPQRRAKRFALIALSISFVVAGVNHFVNPDFFVRIMPPYLPAHLELVYLSGVFEILGGIGVLFAAVRVLARWGLIVLLLAVFPANIHMAIHPELFPEMSATVLYARLPIQFIFIAWVYWATRFEVFATAVPRAAA
jgi:uncharacterized membrane protein